MIADVAGFTLALPWWPAHTAAVAVYLLATVRFWRPARHGSARSRSAARDLLTLLAPPAVTVLTGIHLIPVALCLFTTI
ncbi:hypothetical protein OHV05_37655 (plasmid) [Kitasatospora sp. NBC_00070]